VTDLGFTRDRHLNVRKSGKPDLQPISGLPEIGILNVRKSGKPDLRCAEPSATLRRAQKSPRSAQHGACWPVNKKPRGTVARHPLIGCKIHAAQRIYVGSDHCAGAWRRPHLRSPGKGANKTPPD